MNNNRHTNTTLDLINDLLQNVPDIDYQLRNLSNTKLLENISIMIFNKGKHFLKHILSKIRNPNNPDYNPNYKFSIKVLKIAEENIKEKYGPSSELVLKNIEKFRYINRDLKNYFHEQWRKYNPNLKSRFFKCLDTPEKTYWFGFLCSDGSITSGNDPSRKRYQVSIEIAKKDRSHLVKFCRAVGLNPAKIGERTKILNNKKHRLVYIIFTCKPMFQDIENLGLREFKEGNELKFNLKNNNLSYALLLGIYDGDGSEGRTIIYSTNYSFLLQIKNVYKIKTEIRKREVDEIDENLKFRIKRTKPIYEIGLNPNLLNKMMNSYHNSLARKRKRFSERLHVMETIKNKIRSPVVLEKLIKTHGKEKIAKMLNVSFNTLHKLSIEWDVNVKKMSATEKLKAKVKTKENLINMIETDGKEKTVKELKIGYKTLLNLMDEWNIKTNYLTKRELLKKKIGSKENLQELLKNSSFTQLAKRYGVGRNTLKRLYDEWEI
jgi:transposase